MMDPTRIVMEFTLWDERTARQLLAALGIPEGVRLLPTEHGLLYLRPCEECGGSGYYDGPTEQCGCWLPSSSKDDDAEPCSRHACRGCGGDGYVISALVVEFEKPYAVVALPEEQENT